MKKFDELLKQMDLKYFGTGTHKISFEKMMELLKENKGYLLDVRAKEECEYINFPFAYNIPIDEIPDRISEIPKGKTIIVFCSSATRATIIYTYLLLHDYDTKILLVNLNEIAGKFKPGYVLKQCESAKG
jgi:rhodanese-related sulfurtransferase